MRGRILVIDHKTPTPDVDSGSASMFSYLKILSRAGFELTFAPFNRAVDSRHTDAITALGIKTLSLPEWPSIKAMIEAFAPRSDVVLLCRAPFAAQVFNLVRQVAPMVRILFHATDLHFLRMEREAAINESRALADTAREMRAIELALLAQADASIVVSTYEHELLSELLPQATVHRIPILRDTPPRPRGISRWHAAKLNRRHGVLFVGSYSHPPNVDAVRWLVREVWPLLQLRNFPHHLVIAGSDMPEEIATLASDTIDVRGYVEDLTALFTACRLSVAPLRWGAGIKGKIVTSLSHGVPVVATSVAAEGMNLRDGEDILIADTPSAIADRIVTLCDDAELWRRLSANGYQTFQNQFSLEAGEGAILGVVDGLVASTRGSYKQDGLSAPLEYAGRNDSLSGLQEKEAVILRLHAACTDLQDQLQEKEAVILRLHAACTDLSDQLQKKEAVILRLHAACTDLQDQLQEKEAVILRLHAACTDLSDQLQKKEAVILRLHTAWQTSSQLRTLARNVARKLLRRWE